jgi:uncharacterized protein (DUF433 family)
MLRAWSMNFEPEAPPLHLDDGGTCRVARTRVTLESILSLFRRGDTAQEIHQAFPTVPLSEIYATIAYYLKHKEEVDAYLKEAEEIEERVRRQIDSQFPEELREKIAAARRKPVSS